MLPERFGGRHRFALFRQFEPQFPAFFCFPVEHLRYRRGTANLAQAQHFDLKLAAVVFDAQKVAGAHLAGGLRRLSVRFDSAEFTGAGSQRAGLEESSRPEPLIDSHWSVDERLRRTHHRLGELSIINGHIRLNIVDRPNLLSADPAVGPFVRHHDTGDGAIIRVVDLRGNTAH